VHDRERGIADCTLVGDGMRSVDENDPVGNRSVGLTQRSRERRRDRHDREHTQCEEHPVGGLRRR
jgi:hypothetical protein